MARLTIANAGRLVLVFAFELFEGLHGTDVGYAAARDDTFLNGSARCGQRVVHAVFLLFHLHLGGCADVEHGYAARELGQTLRPASRVS